MPELSTKSVTCSLALNTRYLDYYVFVKLNLLKITERNFEHIMVNIYSHDLQTREMSLRVSLN